MLLKKLFGAPTVTATERDLIDAIRADVIPNPEVLRERLAALDKQIDAAEAEWEQLDRRGDSASFLQLQPIAERLQALRADAAALPPRIRAAETRREAFLQLNRLFEALAADVAARTQVLLEHPPRDAGERDVQLRVLDQATRIHLRVAGRLAAISTSRQFRDPPDALKVLRVDLEARLRELDRLRAPGMRPALTWPPQMLALLEVTEDRAPRKETA